MTSSNGGEGTGDLERRLAAVEGEVSRLREQMALASTDAVAARVLAAGADHDVAEVRAELRAHTQVLNALRETQLEQGRQLAEQGQRLAGHGRQLAEQGQQLVGLDRRMAEGFDMVNTGMGHIVGLLESLTSGDDASPG